MSMSMGYHQMVSVSEYQAASAKFGLSVGIPITKQMVVGREATVTRCQLQWKVELC